ncbi:VanZ family protein [Lentibacillus sediminis]|uniref:VanZ family protein n=1 Tax=Lentibacillus sediminis TaxID=1940529 RepID=UPI000C1C6749|nr:VanZ family protein [Lentibacillus sediminis]
MGKWLYWLLPIGWMGIIFYSSAQPYENQDIRPLLGNFLDLSFLEPFLAGITFSYNGSEVSVAAQGVAGFLEFFIRKGAHVGVFFVLCCFFFLALRKTTSFHMRTSLVISFFGTVAYAITDEIHQGFTPNRTPYVGDIILDSVGAIAAVGCLWLFQRWKTPKTRQNTQPK